MKRVFLLVILLIPVMASAQKNALSPRLGLNVVNRFGGQAFLKGSPSENIIIPMSTTLIELTYGSPYRGFYSAFRFITPLKTDNALSQILDINRFYGNSTKLGFSLGGVYGFGSIDPATGKGSSLNIITATTFDFNVYNPDFKINESSPGFLAWGLEMMIRYNYNLHKHFAVTLGFDFGYSITSYVTSDKLEILGIPVMNQFGLIHSLSFGGVIGFKF